MNLTHCVSKLLTVLKVKTTCETHPYHVFYPHHMYCHVIKDAALDPLVTSVLTSKKRETREMSIAEVSHLDTPMKYTYIYIYALYMYIDIWCLYHTYYFSTIRTLYPCAPLKALSSLKYASGTAGVDRKQLGPGLLYGVNNEFVFKSSAQDSGSMEISQEQKRGKSRIKGQHHHHNTRRRVQLGSLGPQVLT